VGCGGVRAARLEHYVGNLSDDELDDIALYLNFDMVASPNYMFGIYDGDNSGGTAPPDFIPPGSAEIEDVFEQCYAQRGEPSQDAGAAQPASGPARVVRPETILPGFRFPPGSKPSKSA
jgi:Zn-dependent M28 family amino/carboxypeptidase